MSSKYAFGLLFLLPLALLSGCRSRQDSSSDLVLATIGDRFITVEEFQRNYEFGHGHLRSGPQPRRTYLDLLIWQKLLALEAVNKRLDTVQAFRNNVQTLEEELRIERVFEEKVLKNIEVTEEEIRDEVNRAAVRFQFRFLPARSYPAAVEIRERLLSDGFESTEALLRDVLSELNVIPGELQSPPVKAEDIDPFLLSVLQDLEVNTPSEPVEYNGLWYVFEVTDLRRGFVSEEDYETRAETYRKVVYNRKAMSSGAAFVASTMEPKNVVTNREGFERLNDALWIWYSRQVPVRNLLFYFDSGDGLTANQKALQENFDLELVSFEGQTWTIRTFLEHFTPGRYVLRAEEEDSFKARLSDIVALVVRDYVFLEMSRKERLDKDDTFRRTMTLWREQWLFEGYRRSFRNRFQASDAELREYYGRKESLTAGSLTPFDELPEEMRARLFTRYLHDKLQQLADSLAEVHPVEVNYALLDSLPTMGSDVQPRMTVLLFKNNANKMPYPVVDPEWIDVY